MKSIYFLFIYLENIDTKNRFKNIVNKNRVKVLLEYKIMKKEYMIKK